MKRILNPYWDTAYRATRVRIPVRLRALQASQLCEPFSSSGLQRWFCKYLNMSRRAGWYCC